MAKFRAVNCVAMSGRLTADPLITTVARGTTRMFFTIACNRSFRSNDGRWQEKTDFAGVTIWAEQADALAKLTKTTKKVPATLKKGTMVFVDGSFESGKSKDGTKFYSGIRANKVSLVDMDDPVEVGENAPVEKKEVHIDKVSLTDLEGDDLSEPTEKYEKSMQLGATAISVLSTGLV